MKSRLGAEAGRDEGWAAIRARLPLSAGAPDLWRDAGVVNDRVDKVEAAVAALEEYVRSETGEAAHYRASALLQELKGRLG